jgi:hypothetical protein
VILKNSAQSCITPEINGCKIKFRKNELHGLEKKDFMNMNDHSGLSQWEMTRWGKQVGKKKYPCTPPPPALEEKYEGKYKNRNKID